MLTYTSSRFKAPDEYTSSIHSPFSSCWENVFLFFFWLDVRSSSRVHCYLWHSAILRPAYSVQPACESVWPWSGCTKFCASESHWDYMDQWTKTMTVKAAKSFRVEMLTLSGISSTTNIFTLQRVISSKISLDGALKISICTLWGQRWGMSFIISDHNRDVWKTSVKCEKQPVLKDYCNDVIQYVLHLCPRCLTVYFCGYTLHDKQERKQNLWVFAVDTLSH